MSPCARQPLPIGGRQKHRQRKLKKGAAKNNIELIENPDILATLAKAGNRRPRLVVGFAAETSDLIKNATQKFTRKNCDWIVANEVGAGKSFQSG